MSINDPYLGPDASYDRLYREYKKHGSLCIGFDFDGTVHDFHKTGATYPAMLELLRELKDIGCRLVCWTAHEDLNYVIKYLHDNNIPYDGLNCDGIKLTWYSRKPFFSALLDDRAGLHQVFWELKGLVRAIKNEQDDNSKPPGY